MTAVYLKSAPQAAAQHDASTAKTVADILADIEAGGEAAVRRWSDSLDSWCPASFLVSRDEVERAAAAVPAAIRADIDFSLEQVRTFAAAQRASMTDLEIELSPGVIAGHRNVPVDVAGCYVPGGRYSHVASAAMSIGTAKTAGVPFVVACSPPRPVADGNSHGDGPRGIHPATVYAMDRAGADAILCLGGVQAIATMAFGLYTGRAADVLAGPGNRFVAEAKRLLFGRVGIDVFAGPTEALIIADETADPWLIAVDLVSQAEHGPDSPTVVITTSRTVGEEVLRLVPEALSGLPSEETASAAWTNCGEVAVVDTREEAASLSDRYGSEHVEVHAADLAWWHDNLRNYGTLFLGEETTVTYGDKSSGPNHILPTRGASRYTGGLWVGKFLKTLSFQSMTREASRAVGQVAARVSRIEGMEGHARSADVRIAKYFPGERVNLVPDESAHG
ncbi:histidinol dehydrogenase [Mycolicibacterium moriokaense]|nr:histidinol dehydrogenase [Mycolicibacterium moriokaense]